MFFYPRGHIYYDLLTYVNLTLEVIPSMTFTFMVTSIALYLLWATNHNILVVTYFLFLVTLCFTITYCDSAFINVDFQHILWAPHIVVSLIFTISLIVVLAAFSFGGGAAVSTFIHTFSILFYSILFPILFKFELILFEFWKIVILFPFYAIVFFYSILFYSDFRRWL